MNTEHTGVEVMGHNEREELRNEISRIRYDILKNGETIITPERYDILQREWIRRCGDEVYQTKIDELSTLVAELEGALKASEAKSLQLSQKLSIAYAREEALAGTK